MQEQRKTLWSRPKVIEAIQEFVSAHGRTPTAREWQVPGPWPDPQTVQRHFGTWSDGIRAAGFVARLPGQKREKPPTPCRQSGCPETARKRGFCSKHYSEWYRTAHPERVLESRQLGQVKKNEYHRKYYLANQERIKKANADRYQRFKDEDLEGLRERQRRQWAKDKYGLTLEEYREILSRGCAICGHRGRVCVDHDHTTGKVRDALCHGCNFTLGAMKDDPDLLRAAADYIEQHRKGAIAA